MSSLKIVHIVEAAEGGVARHLHDLLDGLASAGHRSLVAYAPKREDSLFRLMRQQLNPRHVEFVTIAMDRGFGSGDLSGWLAVRHLLASTCRHYNIIHAHSSKAGGLTRIAAPTALQSRVVYTPHAFFSMNPQLRWYQRRGFAWAERTLARRCGAVIVVSPQEYQHAIRIGIPAEKIHLIPHGIAPVTPSERAIGNALRASLPLDEDAFVFAFVGRFVAQKAPEIALRAFMNAAVRRPDIQLIMAGDGPLESTLKKLVADAGLDRRVHFPGRIEGRVVFLAANAAIQPSRYESFGYVFLEALAAKIPLVTTRTGVAEILSASSGSVRLISVDDTRAAESAMIEIANFTPTTTASFEELNFTRENMTASTIALYRTLCDSANFQQ